MNYFIQVTKHVSNLIFNFEEFIYRFCSTLGEKPFKCDEDDCNQTFRKFSNLSRHKKTVHNGVRSHACKLCDKTYSSRQGLKKHMVVHATGALEKQKKKTAENSEA